MKRHEVYKLIEDHYRENFDTTVKNLSGHLGQKANAEDIVQEAYTRALTYWKTYDEELGVGPWIRTIINNSMKDFFRVEMMQGMTDGDPQLETIPASAFQRVEVEEMLKVMADKPYNISRILHMYLIDGYSAKEVEQVVPENAANIRKIIQRFREEVR